MKHWAIVASVVGAGILGYRLAQVREEKVEEIVVTYDMNSGDETLVINGEPVLSWNRRYMEIDYETVDGSIYSTNTMKYWGPKHKGDD